MIYTIGSAWLLIYALAAIACIVGGAIWIMIAISDRDRPVGGSITMAAGLVFVYFAIFAGTHFQVPINQRALLVNTIQQTVIGTRESGIQSKPLFGVDYTTWPANREFKVFIDLKPGTQSATSKNSAPLFVDTTFYLDLREMDIQAAFQAFNGDWDKFVESYLTPQFANLNRTVAQRYTTKEHETKRDAWETDFENEAKALLETNGYGITFVSGRTIMAWDFVSDEDARAYDTANRASYLVDQRENERQALMVEVQMSQIRAGMIISTTQATTGSLREVANFLASQPAEMRPMLMEYLSTQVNLEYLRLVAQQQPATIFPPNGGPHITYPVAPPVSSSEVITQSGG